MAAELIWHDPREALGRALEEALSDSGRTRLPALLLVEVDSHARLEHRAGPTEADRVLDGFQHRLAELAGDDALVIRACLDRFAVLLPCAGEVQADLIAQEIRQTLRGPESISVRTGLRVSIGIRAAELGQAPESIMRDAGAALEAARSDPVDSVKAFDPFLLHASQARRALGEDLAEAVRSRRLGIAYQPIVGLAPSALAGQVQGVEALARWTHPVLGAVPPDTFIPLAEEIGLAVELDRQVQEMALAQLRAWQHRPGLPAGFRLSVNITPANLQFLGYLDQVRAALADSGIAPEQLVLELTEASFVTGSEVDVYSLEGLSRLGVGLDIDDFGTGYSSIGYLRRLPARRAKIDRSLLGDVAGDPEQRRFLKAVVGLVRSCGLDAVVEGIETAEQAAAVAAVGASAGQGYYFSRPLPEPEMTAFLEARQQHTR